MAGTLSLAQDVASVEVTVVLWVAGTAKLQDEMALQVELHSGNLSDFDPPLVGGVVGVLGVGSDSWASVEASMM